MGDFDATGAALSIILYIRLLLELMHARIQYIHTVYLFNVCVCVCVSPCVCMCVRVCV